MDFFKKLLFFSVALLGSLSELQAERFTFSFTYEGESFAGNTLEVRYLMVQNGTVEQVFSDNIRVEEFEGKEVWIEIKNISWSTELAADKAKRTSLVILAKDLPAFPGLHLKETKVNNWRLKPNQKKAITIKYQCAAAAKGTLAIPFKVFIPLASNTVAGGVLQKNYSIGKLDPVVEQAQTAEPAATDVIPALTAEDLYWQKIETTQDTLAFAKKYVARFGQGKYGRNAQALIAQMRPIEVSKLLVAKNTFEIQIQHVNQPYIDSIQQSRPNLLKAVVIKETIDLPLMVRFRGRGSASIFLKDQWGKAITIVLDNSFSAVLDSSAQLAAYRLSIDGGEPPYQIEFNKAGTEEVVQRLFGIQDASIDWKFTFLQELKLNGAYDVYVSDKRKDFKVLAGSVEVKRGFHIPVVLWLALAFGILAWTWRWIKKRYVDPRATVFDEEV